MLAHRVRAAFLSHNAKRFSILKCQTFDILATACYPGVMARPKKEDALDAKSYVGARVSNELRGSLEAMAERNGRLLTDEVREALEAHVKKSTRSRK